MQVYLLSEYDMLVILINTPNQVISILDHEIALDKENVYVLPHPRSDQIKKKVFQRSYSFLTRGLHRLIECFGLVYFILPQL